MRPVKTQISLLSLAIWLQTSLFIYIVYSIQRFSLRAVRVLFRLRKCIGWSWTLLTKFSILNLFYLQCALHYINAPKIPNAPQRRKRNLRMCASSKDSDRPPHLCRLIRIFTRRILVSHVCKVSSHVQQRRWSDCADAQADLNLRLVLMSTDTLFDVSV